MIHAEYVFSIKNALKMAEIGKYYFFQKTLDKFLFSGIIIPVRATRANEYIGFV